MDERKNVKKFVDKRKKIKERFVERDLGLLRGEESIACHLQMKINVVYVSFSNNDLFFL